jgi:hypothetical protein
MVVLFGHVGGQVVHRSGQFQQSLTEGGWRRGLGFRDYQLDARAFRQSMALVQNNHAISHGS